MSTLGWAAERPAYSALSSERGLLLPSLDETLACHVQQLHASLAAQVNEQTTELPVHYGTS